MALQHSPFQSRVTGRILQALSPEIVHEFIHRIPLIILQKISPVFISGTANVCWMYVNILLSCSYATMQLLIYSFCRGKLQLKLLLKTFGETEFTLKCTLIYKVKILLWQYGKSLTVHFRAPAVYFQPVSLAVPSGDKASWSRPHGWCVRLCRLQIRFHGYMSSLHPDYVDRQCIMNRQQHLLLCHNTLQSSRVETKLF